MAVSPTTPVRDDADARAGGAGAAGESRAASDALVAVRFGEVREKLEAWLPGRPSRLALVTLGRLRRADVLGESPGRGASVRGPPGGTAARRQRRRKARRASLPARLAERAGRGRRLAADPVARAAPALPRPAAAAALRSLAGATGPAGPRRVAVGASGRVAVGPSRPPAVAKAKAQRGRGRGRPFRPRLGSIREEEGAGAAEAVPAARRIRTPPALLAERWHAQSLARLRRAYRRHQGWEAAGGGSPRRANRPSLPAAVSWKNNLVMAR